MKEKQYYDYIFILPGNTFSRNFLMCWSKTLEYLQGSSYMYITGYSSIVSRTRNSLLSQSQFSDFGTVGPTSFQPTTIFGDAISCKKVIFIDSDMVWSVEDIDNLINSEHEIINGFYPIVDFNTSSLISADKTHFLTMSEIQKHKKPFEVYSSGLGFTACNFDVLKQLEYPWFKVEESIFEHDGVNYQTAIGEDTYFFLKIKELGYKIMADPNIKIGHEKLRVLSL
jgi:hypothetical protein